jgi:hypothetical protein
MNRRHTLELFGQHRPSEWRNRLIWDDKKYVEPDFVVVTSDGTKHIVETKGLDGIQQSSTDVLRGFGRTGPTNVGLKFGRACVKKTG